MKALLNKNASNFNLEIACLLIIYFTDALNKVFLHFTNETPMISKIAKILIIGLLIYFLDKNKIKFFVGLSIIYCIGQLSITPSFSLDSINTFGRFILTLLLLNQIKFQDDVIKRTKFLSVFEIIVIINSLLIFIGFITEFHLFKTYYGHRFGYNAFLPNSSVSTYFYAISLFYFLVKYKENFFLHLKSYIVIGCCIVIGTKAILLVLFFGLITYCFFFRKKIASLIIFGIILLATCLFYYIYYVDDNLFSQIREQNGIITAVFSFRNDNLIHETIEYMKQNWSFVNYIFGGTYDFSYRSELGFIDVFYFWGGLGAIIFLKEIYRIFKNLLINQLYLVLLISLGIIIFLAGNFFSYSSIAIYLVAFKELMYSSNYIANNKK